MWSCWNRTFGRPRKQGTQMSKIERSAFKLPSIKTREMRVAYPIAVQIDTRDSGSLWRYRMHVIDEHSSWSFRTLIRPTEYYKRNWHSFEIRCHYCIQPCLAWELSLSCKRSRNNGRRADSPLCCKRQRTVRADTGRAATMSVSWVMVCDVVEWFSTTNPTICMFSRTLVNGGRWNHVCCSILPSATHWFYIWKKLFGSRPMR